MRTTACAQGESRRQASCSSNAAVERTPRLLLIISASLGWRLPGSGRSKSSGHVWEKTRWNLKLLSRFLVFHPRPDASPMLRSLAAACGRGAAALLATPFQARWKGGGPGGVYKATRLTVIDNSGAKRIKVIDYFGKRPATLGSAVRASVKEAKPDGRVSRKEIVAAVIVRQRAVHTRKDGTTVRFQENAAVLMKRDLSGPVGTRVTGPVARELRAGKFLKVALMASRVI